MYEHFRNDFIQTADTIGLTADTLSSECLLGYRYPDAVDNFQNLAIIRFGNDR